MLTRGQNFKPQPLNIVGSSIFGRYPKISIEKTINMFISDGFMVPYGGYKVGINAAAFDNGEEGRAIYASIKYDRLIIVVDASVYLVNINFNQRKQVVTNTQVIPIGRLQSSTGVVYIAENNKPQIGISDGKLIYIYDETLSPTFQTITTNFIPGRIDFHDTYFLCAASADGATGTSNTWRLSAENDGTSWSDDAASVGIIQTKSDNTQAAVRFPGKGNMIFVMGKEVTEPWMDVGYQLFPYQRNNSYNIDYGCLNPATIAAMEDFVVWLGANEKSGPVILMSDGGAVKKLSADETDGIDYFLSNMQNPSDSQAFMYRQDGHLFYHINFYTDNVSLFYDFNTKKFFHASDEFGNYFIASSVAFFNNQYYFVSRNNGNLYVFDTIYTDYDGKEIPRIRTCKSIRNAQQESFIANDLGFTIESGNTNYQVQDRGPIYLTTENGDKIITEGDIIFFVTEDGDYLVSEDGDNLISEQEGSGFDYLIAEQHDIVHITPCVDLSISIDGGEHFSSYDRQYLPAIGQRKNKLAWWQIGACNDLVCQFRFWGFGRFVATDGVVNTRQ